MSCSIFPGHNVLPRYVELERWAFLLHAAYFAAWEVVTCNIDWWLFEVIWRQSVWPDVHALTKKYNWNDLLPYSLRGENVHPEHNHDIFIYRSLHSLTDDPSRLSPSHPDMLYESQIHQPALHPHNNNEKSLRSCNRRNFWFDWWSHSVDVFEYRGPVYHFHEVQSHPSCLRPLRGRCTTHNFAPPLFCCDAQVLLDFSKHRRMFISRDP